MLASFSCSANTHQLQPTTKKSTRVESHERMVWGFEVPWQNKGVEWVCKGVNCTWGLWAVMCKSGGRLQLRISGAKTSVALLFFLQDVWSCSRYIYFFVQKYIRVASYKKEWVAFRSSVKEKNFSSEQIWRYSALNSSEWVPSECESKQLIKNITIIHTTPGNELMYCEAESCLYNKLLRC